MNKKVVLINICGENHNIRLNSRLPFGMQTGPHFPLGINSLASYLKKKIPKIPLFILDSQISTFQQIKEDLKRIKPNIIGLSCTFKDYEKALEVARIAKSVNASVIMGGNHATSLAKEILTNRGINSDDYCVDGVIKQDGEIGFYKYVKGESLSNIDNLVYCNNGDIKENKIKSLLLDQLSLSKNLDQESYFQEYQKRFPNSCYKRPFLICSQKGCRWRSESIKSCLFCSLMHKDLRLKDPKIVWKEIDKLVFDYGIDYIWDVSDSLLSDKNWFKEFYNESQKRSKRPFFKIQARVDELVDENIVKILVNLNVAQIFIGFESGDDKSLSYMRKGTTSEINKKAVLLLKKYNLPIRAYFVLGAPKETVQSLSNTSELIEKIFDQGKDHLVIPSHFTPLPGSLSFELLKQRRKKYLGKDLINWDEAIIDWTECFCKVPYYEIHKAVKRLRRFPDNISDYSF